MKLLSHNDSSTGIYNIIYPHRINIFKHTYFHPLEITGEGDSMPLPVVLIISVF